MSQEKEFVFRKLDGKWTIYGPSGYHGQEIEVRKRDNTIEKKQLGQVLSEGMVFYEIVQDENSKSVQTESIPVSDNANFFRKEGDSFIVHINDGVKYEVNDPIVVRTKKGDKTYKVKTIDGNKCTVQF